MKELIPLIIIEGPTGSGKSGLAMKLAKFLNTEIISADSRQIYRYMDIGTSKPTIKDREEVSHHLIDIIDPDTEYSAGRFVSDATVAIKTVHDKENQLRSKDQNSRIPIIVGGTGFYIQALLQGLCEAPAVNEGIRQELDRYEHEKGSEYLYSVLEKVDPESALKVHPNDTYRLKRALEVWIATGKKLSTHWMEQEKQEKKYNVFRIYVDIDRDELYRRIGIRLEKMIEKGLINEIKKLLDKGYRYNDPGLTSVGYKEFLPFILENKSFLESMEQAKKNTRNYAKRQVTWYRKRSYNLKVNPCKVKVKEIHELIRNYFD